jgi:hypothetical protein
MFTKLANGTPGIDCYDAPAATDTADNPAPGAVDEADGTDLIVTSVFYEAKANKVTANDDPRPDVD